MKWLSGHLFCEADDCKSNVGTSTKTFTFILIWSFIWNIPVNHLNFQMVPIFQDGCHFWHRKHIFLHRISLVGPIWEILCMNGIFLPTRESILQPQTFFSASLCHFEQRMWKIYIKDRIIAGKRLLWMMYWYKRKLENIQLTNMILEPHCFRHQHKTKDTMHNSNMSNTVQWMYTVHDIGLCTAYYMMQASSARIHARKSWR